MGNLTKSKHKDYFNMFEESADIALRAAKALQHAFSSEGIDTNELKAIKDIEHEGDLHVHNSLKVIEAAFITPFDNDQMMAVLNGVETVTDSIEEVSADIYRMRIKNGDKYVEHFLQLAVQSIAELQKLMVALRQFKKDSKELRERIIEVNHLEEIGDQTYTDAMYDLFGGSYEAIDVIRYKRIYEDLEDTLDCCEDVADTIEGILIAAT